MFQNQLKRSLSSGPQPTCMATKAEKDKFEVSLRTAEEVVNIYLCKGKEKSYGPLAADKEKRAARRVKAEVQKQLPRENQDESVDWGTDVDADDSAQEDSDEDAYYSAQEDSDDSVQKDADEAAQSRQGERPASGSSARDRSGRTHLDEEAATDDVEDAFRKDQEDWPTTMRVETPPQSEEADEAAQKAAIERATENKMENLQRIVKTSVQQKLDRMLKNPPVRNGQPIAKRRLLRASRGWFKAAIHKISSEKART